MSIRNWRVIKDPVDFLISVGAAAFLFAGIIAVGYVVLAVLFGWAKP